MELTTLTQCLAADALFTWSGGPEIFRIGPLPVRWYGVLFATGFALGFLIVKRMFLREGKPLQDLDALLITLIVSTLIGARLGHCFFYHPDYYLANPLRIVEIWKGGLASHGGGLGIITGLWIYSRRRPDQPFLWLLDRVAVPIALTGSLIRLGNFFNSEIVGVPTDAPWAIVFARFDDVPRHPAQLYESLSYLTIFTILFTVYRRKAPNDPRGLVSGLFFVLVFSARFLIEFVKRRQADYASDLPLRVGQMLSILPVLAGAALLVYAFTKGSRSGAGNETGAPSPARGSSR